jgi:DNA-binding FadR family transcriptional regulator
MNEEVRRVALDQDEAIDDAVRTAVREALRDHASHGREVVIWRNGRPTFVCPDLPDAEVPLNSDADRK